MMPFIAQRADDFGGERVVQQLEHALAVGAVGLRHRPIGHMLAGLFADFLQIHHERIVGLG
jgi:hypothetical protein